MYIGRLILVSLCFFVLGVQVSSAQSGIRFFEDQNEFGSLCNEFSFEDFEDTNIPPDNNVGCDGLLDNMTDNRCYSPGAVIPGFSLGTIGLDFFSVRTPTRFGLLNVAVGPEIGQAGVINFTEAVNAVGLVFVDVRSELTHQIRVFGESGSLLATQDLLVAIDIGTFMGFVSSGEPISRIEYDSGSPRQDILLYELSFGQCDLTRPIPTLSEWGLIAMAAVLGVIGLIAVRRRNALV